MIEQLESLAPKTSRMESRLDKSPVQGKRRASGGSREMCLSCVLKNQKENGGGEGLDEQGLLGRTAW